MEDALRYPIGRYVRRATPYSARERDEHIGRLERLPARLAEVLHGMPEAAWERPYRPGGWSIGQLVHHVADSHSQALIRLKLGLTEEAPTIKAYDQDAWVTLPDVLTVSPLVSVALLEGTHRKMTAILRAMVPEQFARLFVHPENGPTTLDQLAALYAWHGDHHLAQLTTARASFA
jgi:hypothetical protein